MRAYRRTESGALEIVTLYREGDEIVNIYGDRQEQTMTDEKAKALMGWVAFQGMKHIVPDEKVSPDVADTLNLAIEADKFLLANREKPYSANPAFVALLAREELDRRALHYAARQKLIGA